MEANTFQKEALRKATQNVEGMDAVHLALMGLASEACEALGCLVKAKMADTNPDQKAILNELGDVAWFLAYASNALGYTLDDVLQASLERVEDRYPDGFTPNVAAAKLKESRNTGCRKIETLEKAAEPDHNAIFQQYESQGFLTTVWWPNNALLHGRPFSVKNRALYVKGTPSWRVIVDIGNGKKEEHLLTPRSVIALKVSVYADDTDLFTEEEILKDNNFEFVVPYELWEDFLCDNPDKTQGYSPLTFLNYSLREDMDGFYSFCVQHGYFPRRGMPDNRRFFKFDWTGKIATAEKKEEK